MKRYLCYNIWEKMQKVRIENYKCGMTTALSGVKKKCAENIRKEMHPNVNTDYLVLAELWTVLIFVYYFYFLS